MPDGFSLIMTVAGADSAPDWSVEIPIELTFPSTAGCWGTASSPASPTRDADLFRSNDYLTGPLVRPILCARLFL
jgi:hypothetical protein